MSRTIRTASATLALAAVLSLQLAPQASARPDVGDTRPLLPRSACGRLERIDDQLVRCDLLTGNGVSAPVWIPEQRGSSAED